jgi:hypothetical protein
VNRKGLALAVKGARFRDQFLWILLGTINVVRPYNDRRNVKTARVALDEAWGEINFTDAGMLKLVFSHVALVKAPSAITIIITLNFNPLTFCRRLAR